MPADDPHNQESLTPTERLNVALLRPVTSDRLGWSDVRVEHLVSPPDAEVELPPTTHHWLILNHAPAADFSLRFADQERTRLAPPNSITLIPAGHPSRWRWRGAASSTHVLLDPLLLRRIATEALDLNPDQVNLNPIADLSHPKILSSVLALSDELQQGGPGGHLLADSLGNVLAVHLLRHFSAKEPLEIPSTNGLPKKKLQAVLEYVEEHLDALLSLEHLAAVAHLSPYHFARLFKNSTGLPPHRYLIARRVERAKELLRKRNRPPLALVAAEVGFADQSHFTRHFRRLVGVTPRRFE